MKLNFGCTINKSGFDGGVNYDEVLTFSLIEEQIKSGVFDSDKDMLGWLKLPFTQQSELDKIKDFGKFVNDNFENFVVFGIGGSALGAIAVYNAVGKQKSKLGFYVLDNVDPDEFSEVINKIDITKTMFNIITKSGSTVETLTQMSVIIKLLTKAGCDYTKHLVVTTEEGNSLCEYAKNNNIPHFSLARDVGGRFSVLSSVGLLPMAVMGIDIFSVLKGAKDMLEKAKQNSLTENAPLMSAVINFILAKEGKEEIVVMPYSYKLKTMSDFYLQLLGESLGKKNKCDGSENPLTITPIKAVGVTDQHSQMQLYFEGRNNKTFCFIGQESFDNEFFSSPLDIASYNDNRPQTMGQLLNVERQATMFALYNNNKPCYLITIDEVDEYAVGELIMYFELVTAFMGELMEINAYNQPGVEAGKINTKALLNNKKFRQEKENLLIVREECDKFIINS